jgi:hypothetical protein
MPEMYGYSGDISALPGEGVESGVSVSAGVNDDVGVTVIDRQAPDTDASVMLHADNARLAPNPISMSVSQCTV